MSDPSVLFNIYEPKWPYPMVGPPAYVSGVSSAEEAKDVLKPQTEGLLPQDVILTNANWYATELASYSTEDGCWNVSCSPSHASWREESL